MLGRVQRNDQRNHEAPQNDCNGDSKVYAGRPTGNSPELMPLDCSIFKDLDDVVNRHIALTSLLKKGADGYELRFSRRDPKAIVFAYERIWTANPLGKRICQDVNRCFGKHLLAIRAAGGHCVQGLGSWNGHRRIHGVGVGGGRRRRRRL